MNILTEKNFERFMDFQDLVEEKSNDLLTELNTLKEIEDYKHLSFNKIGYYNIEYTGYDSWRQEEKSYSLPLQLLYDEEYKEKYIQKIKMEVEEKKKKESERNTLSEQNKLLKEKEQYEALKVKFEGDKK